MPFFINTGRVGASLNPKTAIFSVTAFCSYLILAQLSLRIGGSFGDHSVIWLPSGFYLAFILLRGVRFVPLLSVAAFLVELEQGNGIASSLLNASSEQLQVLLTVALLRRTAFDARLGNIKSYYLLLASSVTASFLCGALVASLHWLVEARIAEGEYGAVVTGGVMGEVLGIMLITPLMLIFYINQQGFTLQRRKSEFVLFLLAAFSFEQLTLFGQGNYLQTLQLGNFWMFLWMIFTALRLGRHGVAIGLVVIFGSCWWRYDTQNFDESAYLDFWLHHISLNICSMTLAIALYEQRHLARQFDSETIKYETLVNTLPDMVWLKDTQLNYLACNQAFEQFLGVSQDHIIGKNSDALFAEDIAERCLRSDREALDATDPLTTRLSLPLNSQSPQRYLEIVKTPIRETDGLATSLLCVAKDITDIVTAEKGLKASEARAHAIIEATPVPMVLNDDRGNLLYLNPAFTKTFGYTLTDLNKLEDLWSLTYPDDEGRKKRRERGVPHPGRDEFGRFEMKNCEVPIRDKYGHMQCALATASCVDPHTQMVTLFDITEHKRLRTDRSRLYRSVASTANEIYIIDAEKLHFSFVNKGALNNLGYTMAELKKMTPLDLMVTYTATEFDSLLERLKRREKNGQLFETVHQRKDGSLYNVKVYLQLFAHGDEAPYFLAIVLDISEKKQLEAKMSTVVDAINAVIWSVDADLRINYVSQQAEQQLLSMGNQELIGKGLIQIMHSDLFHDEERAMLLDVIQTLIAKHIPVKNLECRVRNRAGRWKWMAVSLTPILDANAKLQQIVGVMHDLSLQKHAEEQLRNLNMELDKRVNQEVAENRKKDLLLQQQNKMAAMGEMIGNIAHQWRQPLNALAIILMDLEDAFAHGEATTESIHHSVQHSYELLSKMSRTIDDFRNFFKNDKELAKIQVSEVVTESVRLLESTLTHHQIQLTLAIKQQQVMAYIYSGELSQAVLCLINNAKDQLVRNQIPQGRIRVEIDADQDWAIIRISDNGGGIAEQDWPKLFDPYFTTKAEGTGLGLYITKLTVEQSMHGKITVENIEQGARFSLFLPKERELIDTL